MLERKSSLTAKSDASAAESGNLDTLEHPSTHANHLSRKTRKAGITIDRQREVWEPSTRSGGLSKREALPRRSATPYAQPKVEATHIDPKVREFESREREVEARERELQHQEEVLKWKHKAFLLEQKLAKAKQDIARPSKTEETSNTFPSRSSYDHVTGPNRRARDDSRPIEEWKDPYAEIQVRGWNNPYTELQAQAPPLQQGESMQTRIKLPKRK
jgi:hypothetical protein